MIRARLGFHRDSDGKITTRGHAVLKGLGDHVDKFTDPPVKLSDLKTALDNFTSARGKALDGSRTAFAEKKSCRAIVIKMLVQLGHFVERVADDDMALFILSGFEAAGKDTPQKEIKPGIAKITQGKSGELYVWYLAFYRLVIHYQVRCGEQGPNGELPTVWDESFTSRQARRPALFTDLTPAKIYCFQVRALKNDDTYTDWSPIATRMCI